MTQTPCCHIFAAGVYTGMPVRPAPCDYIIAADGGYHHCVAEGFVPHLLLGDFDSLDHIPEGVETLTFPPEKDDTDTMLAVQTGLSRGFRVFHLHACAGGRLDHTLGNLQILFYLAEQGARGFLYTETETFTAIREDSLQLPLRQSGLFSVFCLGPDAEGVSIRGARYPLHDVTLRASLPLGVSNCFMGTPVTISVRRGTLLINWTTIDTDPQRELTGESK